METKDELFKIYQENGYSFDFEDVYSRYRGKAQDWEKLFKAIEKSEKQRRPAFSMKPKKGNDMAAIYRALFGDQREEIYQARLRYMEAFKKSGCKTFKEFESEKGNN